MAGRSGGHYMAKGRWEEYSDGPSWLVEPPPRTPMHNLPDPLASKYPTLADLSRSLRSGYYGNGVSHERLVDILADSVRNRPWQSASDVVFEDWRQRA